MQPPTSTRSSFTRTALLFLLVATSLYCNLVLIRATHNVRTSTKGHGTPWTSSRPLDSYSFIGSDHPELLPVSRVPVRMTVEESVHYSLTNTEAEIEWLYTAPLGDNHIRLGPDKRAFAVAMFHELHCLRGIREALDEGLASLHPVLQKHINHCFNYLRQWVLCSADVTLEPGDFTQRNFTIERFGATHTCADWGPVYDMVNSKWDEWERFREEHGLQPFVDYGQD